MQNVTRPIQQFLGGVQELQNAARRFISGIARRIEFPLSLSLGSGSTLQSLLNLPRHSVETLRQAAMTWSKLLHPLTLGFSLSKPGGGTSLRSGVNDRLTLSVNGGPAHTIDLGNLDGGPAIALAIQEAVRKIPALAMQDAVQNIPPVSPSNVAAFREFTATYAPETGSYQLTSGTIGSPSASVVVLPSRQLPPIPNDAAEVLGLSPAHGGQEQQGSDEPLEALSMLRNVVLACTHLTAFPEYFAESLEEQTETVELLQTSRGPDLRGLMPSAPSQTPDSGGLVPVGSTVLPTPPGLPYLGRVPMSQLPIVQPQRQRATPMQVLTATPPGQRPSATTSPVVRGDQRLTTVLLTPGDTLQSVAARAGVAWETLAVANGLHYPYVMTEPLTLLQSRVQTATPRTLVDRTGGWAPHRFQGHRCDLLAGDGAGQSRRVADNDATTLYLETPWAHVPTVTTDYAIREASNPIIQNGTVTSATEVTLVDAQLHLVPESQRGYTLRLTRGAGMGQERRITQHTPTTYVLETPWDVLPQPGTLYAIVAPRPRSGAPCCLWASPSPSPGRPCRPCHGRCTRASTIPAPSPGWKRPNRSSSLGLTCAWWTAIWRLIRCVRTSAALAACRTCARLCCISSTCASGIWTMPRAWGVTCRNPSASWPPCRRRSSSCTASPGPSAKTRVSRVWARPACTLWAARR